MSERLILWHRWLPPRQDESIDHGRVAAWQRSVATRLSVGGGALLGVVGGTVVASFDPLDGVDALDIALDLLDEAEREAGLEIAIGVALGEVHETEAGPLGGALERAQSLANRARAGDVVLDPGAKALVAAELLFGRQVAGGPGAARGITVDRRHPRRGESAAAIARLGPTPLPPIIDSLQRTIEEALSRGRPRTFVLRGPVGAGATELVAALERAHAPSRVLRVGAAPGGVVPLASLRLALGRLGSPTQVEAQLGGRTGTTLAAVAAGELVDQRTLAEALAGLAEGERPWVVLSPLGLVDGASLGALLEARALGADFVLFGRFPVDSALPRPLTELDEEVVELTLPPLKTADARVVAEAVLGPHTGEEVSRRVAVLGGDTVLGVVEAARTLIATGELVGDGDGFVWRLAPRKGAHAIGTVELLTQRFDLLDLDSRRVLEALCVVPDGSARPLLARIAARDGLGENAFARSLEVLAREALLEGTEHPRPASSLLRWCMLSLIPPARFTELHRFVAEALREAAPTAVPLRIELGYYLVEAGLDAEGRLHLTDSLEPLLAGGYERTARQLSAWLAQHDEARSHDDEPRPAPTVPGEYDEEVPPSTEVFLDELLEAHAPSAVEPALTRRLAPAPRASDDELEPLAREPFDTERPPPPDDEAERDEPRLAQDVVRALRARDFTALEETIQRAIAEGSDLGAVERVRALAELARGDLEAARRSLREARRRSRGPGTALARDHLAEALLELHAGEPLAGVRSALAALAVARRASDARGEAASRRALAACYRALGRGEQASRLEA